MEKEPNIILAPVSASIEDLQNETDHLITQVTDAIDKWRKENDAMGTF